MAVYTDVSDDDLQRFVTGFGLGRLHNYKGIAEGVENTNYLVTTDRGPYILTLYEKRVAVEDLPFFLGLMEHLASKGINCPQPIRDPAGNILAELSGKPAALVTFLDGVWPRRPTAVHCVGVGGVLARLHLAARDFAIARPNALGPRGWRQLFQRFETQADALAAGLRKQITDELAALDTAWPKDLPTGVVHADLFPDNVFFLGDEVSGVIDFYFACNDMLAYDVAICLNAWCFEADFSFNQTKARALLRAYQRVRPLSEAEIAAMPVLCRGAALRFLMTRAYDWINTPPGALVRPHDPIAYLRRLKFHQMVTSPAEYGLEIAP
jgi:homoserine kinase type II